jgi:hypothetical protein
MIGRMGSPVLVLFYQMIIEIWLRKYASIQDIEYCHGKIVKIIH